MNPEEIMRAAVRTSTASLTTMEMASLYNCMTAGWNPQDGIGHVKAGYDKARALFTQNGGTRMHPLTLEIYGAILRERLAREEDL